MLFSECLHYRVLLFELAEKLTLVVIYHYQQGPTIEGQQRVHSNHFSSFTSIPQDSKYKSVNQAVLCPPQVFHDDSRPSTLAR